MPNVLSHQDSAKVSDPRRAVKVAWPYLHIPLAPGTRDWETSKVWGRESYVRRVRTGRLTAKERHPPGPLLPSDRDPTPPFGSGRIQALQDYIIGPSLTAVQQPELSGGSLGGLCPGSAWEVSPPPGGTQPSQSPTIGTKGNYPASFSGLMEAWGPGSLTNEDRWRRKGRGLGST